MGLASSGKSGLSVFPDSANLVRAVRKKSSTLPEGRRGFWDQQALGSDRDAEDKSKEQFTLLKRGCLHRTQKL